MDECADARKKQTQSTTAQQGLNWMDRCEECVLVFSSPTNVTNSILLIFVQNQ